jgi:hypothetical protein
MDLYLILEEKSRILASFLKSVWEIESATPHECNVGAAEVGTVSYTGMLHFPASAISRCGADSKARVSV